MVSGIVLDRSLGRLLGLAAASVVSLTSIASCGRDESTPEFLPENVRVKVELMRRPPEAGYVALALRVKNTGAPFFGTVEIRDEGVAGEPSAVRYRCKLDVSSGATKQLALPYMSARGLRSGGRLRVRFEQSGYRRTVYAPYVSTREVRVRILVLGNSNVPRFQPLGEALLRRLAPYDPAAINSGPRPTFTVESVRPEALSGLADALAPFQLIVLWGVSFADTEPKAINAVRTWVERGGTLVAFPGPEWASGLPPETRDLLGVSLEGRRADVPDVVARLLRRDAAAEPPPEPGDPERKSIAGAYHTIAPDGPAAVDNFRDLLRHSELSLRYRRGAGVVQTCSFTPLGDSFPQESALPGLYSELQPSLARALTFAGDREYGLGLVENVVVPQLYSMASFRVPRGEVVVTALALYLAIGIVVPAWIFRRRRELAFVAIIAAAAVGTIAIYQFGALSAVEQPELSELTIAVAHADGKTCDATSFVSVFSPKPRVIDLAGREFAAADGGLPPRIHPLTGVSDLRSHMEVQHPDTPIRLDASGRMWLAPFRISTNARRSFRIDHRTDLTDLSWSYERGANGPSLRLKNEGKDEILLVSQAPSGFVLRKEPLRADEEADFGLEDRATSLWDRVWFSTDPFRSSGLAAKIRALARKASHPTDAREPDWLPEPDELTVVLDALGLALDPGRSDDPNSWRHRRRAKSASTLAGFSPRYIIAVTTRGLFSPTERFETHRAISFVVFELPSQFSELGNR